jgi:hypothetical protein
MACECYIACMKRSDCVFNEDRAQEQNDRKERMLDVVREKIGGGPAATDAKNETLREDTR